VLLCAVAGQTSHQGVLELLVSQFTANPSLVTSRGALILRQVCVLLPPTRVYLTLASLLPPAPAPLASIMAALLLSSAQLRPLRLSLAGLEDQEAADAFTALFRCWLRAPVSLTALCLLARQYGAAAALVRRLAQHEATVELLAQLDGLVTLLEGPVFCHVRMDLLQPSSAPLRHCLYGVLQLLPQSPAYLALATRLKNLPPIDTVPPVPSFEPVPPPDLSPSPLLDLTSLLRQLDAAMAEEARRRLDDVRAVLSETAELPGRLKALVVSMSGGKTGDGEEKGKEGEGAS